MRAKYLLVALLLLSLLVPAPALLAPHVSDDPVRWAYRVYHPFMYRYPTVIGHYSTLLGGQSKLDCSLMILRFTIIGW